MEIPKKHFNRYRLEYSFSSDIKIRFELADSRQWNEIRSELREYWVEKSTKARSIKAKSPVYIHAVNIVSEGIKNT